jgi:hypothetical protein
MPKLRSSLVLALLVLGAPAVSHAQSSSQSARVQAPRRVDAQMDAALRYYGIDPSRLTREQSYALDRMRAELAGDGGDRRGLTRTQATAIVYMALVFPREGRDSRGGYGDDYGDTRGGYGQTNGGRGREPRAGRCTEVEQQAYELGSVVSGSARNAGLFVSDPEKIRARALARTIQQGALQCGNRDAADAAGEIIDELAENLPERAEIAGRVADLKSALRGEPYRNGPRPR